MMKMQNSISFALLNDNKPHINTKTEVGKLYLWVGAIENKQFLFPNF